MKTQAVLWLMLIAPTILQASVQDSIPEWNFYYGKNLLTEGGPGRPTPRATLGIGSNPGDVIVTFSYDFEATFESELEVRVAGELVQKIPYSSNPSGSASAPTVKSGSHFIVHLDVIVSRIDQQPVTLEFFYSDTRIKDIHVGSLTIQRRAENTMRNQSTD